MFYFFSIEKQNTMAKLKKKLTKAELHAKKQDKIQKKLEAKKMKKRKSKVSL